MCLKTMVNDGGLREVLDTADRVSIELLLLNRPHMNGKRQRRGANAVAIGSEHAWKSNASKREYGDSTATTTTSNATVGTRRKPSRNLSELSGNSQQQFLQQVKMNLAKHTSAELKQIVTPLAESLEKLDAAALLSLNPSNKKDGATLDLKRGTTVPPIHDYITPAYDPAVDTSIVRYLHVAEVPNKYSAGIFVFPPNAQIPLHDHPNMVVLSRVLYGELRVKSFDLIPKNAAKSTRNENDRESSNQNCDDRKLSASATSAAKDYGSTDEQAEATTMIPPSKESTTSTSSSFRSPLNILKDLVSRAMSPYYSNSEGEEQLKGDSATDSDSSSCCADGADPHLASESILSARENLSPMGVEKQLRNASASPDDRHQDGEDEQETSLILSAPHVTSLYPYEGNCHSFIAGPHGAAVLDVLLPPYDSEDHRDCTFYQAKEDCDPSVFQHHHHHHHHHHSLHASSPPNQGAHNETNEVNPNGKRPRSYNLTAIDQPENFHCLSGAYGRFGACATYEDVDDTDFYSDFMSEDDAEEADLPSFDAGRCSLS